MKLNWQNKWLAKLRINDETLLPLLFHSGSLTRFIQQQCKGKFEVEIKSEGWRFPIPDEARSLDMNNRGYTFIRESWLKADNHYLIYARTIIPRETYRQISRQLTELGTRPLGELLFSDKSGYRADMRYARIPSSCALFKAARSNARDQEALWARQSLFYIKHKPLLIIEVFLPAIKHCMD